jgi:hypothetical protein
MTTKKNVQMSLMYHQKTKVESFQISNKYFRDNKSDVINEISLEDQSATHVVCGIEWGSNAFITFESQVDDNSSITQTKAKLSTTISNAISWCAQAGVKAGISYTKDQNELLSKTTITVQADMLNSDNEVAMNLEQAVELIRTIPSKLAKHNDGKGVAITFVLISIEDVKKYLGLAYNPRNVVFDIQNEDSIVCLFDEYESKKLEFENSVDSKQQPALNELKNEAKSKSASFRSEFKTSMQQNPIESKTLVSHLKSIIFFYELKLELTKREGTSFTNEGLLINLHEKYQRKKLLFENFLISKSGLEELEDEAKEVSASFTKDFESALKQDQLNLKEMETLLKSKIIFYDIQLEKSKVIIILVC